MFIKKFSKKDLLNELFYGEVYSLLSKAKRILKKAGNVKDVNDIKELQRKIKDKATRGLTSERMIKNYKSRGWPFNAVDDEGDELTTIEEKNFSILDLPKTASSEDIKILFTLLKNNVKSILYKYEGVSIEELIKLSNNKVKIIIKQYLDQLSEIDKNNVRKLYSSEYLELLSARIFRSALYDVNTEKEKRLSLPEEPTIKTRWRDIEEGEVQKMPGEQSLEELQEKFKIDR